jgi:cobyrinic acid a,c-diamide synthase
VQGARVRVFKTGPDFIDPMVLEMASAAPVYNLDCWMVGTEASRAPGYYAPGYYYIRVTDKEDRG